MDIERILKQHRPVSCSDGLSEMMFAAGMAAQTVQQEQAVRVPERQKFSWAAFSTGITSGVALCAAIMWPGSLMSPTSLPNAAPGIAGTADIERSNFGSATPPNESLNPVAGQITSEAIVNVSPSFAAQPLSTPVLSEHSTWFAAADYADPEIERLLQSNRHLRSALSLANSQTSKNEATGSSTSAETDLPVAEQRRRLFEEAL